ncbi:MAG TPA: exosortase B, partial [Rubrivivax sp.]|nr:exosortase B [Rubrivivax sp.]
MLPTGVLQMATPGPNGTRNRVLWALLAAGYLALLIPTVLDLARQVWQTDEQGHGPIIGAVSLWLMWRRRQQLIDAPYRPANLMGGLLFVLSMALYALGRSQQIIQGEVIGLIGAAVALLLLLRGVQGLRVVAFPLFFLLFLVPLPGVLVQALTIPLKTAVSYVAEVLMHMAGYPIGRTGVILTVGPYQLLVADACAGLNSMFTLEALGLLYMNLMGYTSKLRNVLLAVLVIPIAFIANVVRVIVLILVTYHFGDEAGQGFVHTFAGMLLFAVGLAMMLATDTVVGRLLGQRHVDRDARAPTVEAKDVQTGPTFAMPRVAVLFAMMIGATLAARALQPTYRLSEHKPRIALDRQVPEAFGEWRL